LLQEQGKHQKYVSNAKSQYPWYLEPLVMTVDSKQSKFINKKQNRGLLMNKNAVNYADR